jgi:hypothetical protein
MCNSVACTEFTTWCKHQLSLILQFFFTPEKQPKSIKEQLLIRTTLNLFSVSGFPGSIIWKESCSMCHFIIGFHLAQYVQGQSILKHVSEFLSLLKTEYFIIWIYHILKKFTINGHLVASTFDNY